MTVDNQGASPWGGRTGGGTSTGPWGKRKKDPSAAPAAPATAPSAPAAPPIQTFAQMQSAGQARPAPPPAPMSVAPAPTGLAAATQSALNGPPATMPSPAAPAGLAVATQSALTPVTLPTSANGPAPQVGAPPPAAPPSVAGSLPTQTQAALGGSSGPDLSGGALTTIGSNINVPMGGSSGISSTDSLIGQNMAPYYQALGTAAGVGYADAQSSPDGKPHVTAVAGGSRWLSNPDGTWSSQNGAAPVTTEQLKALIQQDGTAGVTFKSPSAPVVAGAGSDPQQQITEAMRGITSVEQPLPAATAQAIAPPPASATPPSTGGSTPPPTSAGTGTQNTSLPPVTIGEPPIDAPIVGGTPPKPATPPAGGGTSVTPAPITTPASGGATAALPSYTPEHTTPGISNDLQSAVRTALQTGSRYNLPEVQKVKDALSSQLDTEFGAQRKQLDEEMARRGVGASSIASGYYGDLAGQQAQAKAGLDASLIQNQAQTASQDIAAALGAGQNLYNSDASTGLGYSQLGLQGSLGAGQLDLGKSQLGQQNEQFGKTLDQQLKMGTMSDTTANRGLDIQNASNNNTLMMQVAALLQSLGYPTNPSTTANNGSSYYPGNGNTGGSSTGTTDTGDTGPSAYGPGHPKADNLMAATQSALGKSGTGGTITLPDGTVTDPTNLPPGLTLPPDALARIRAGESVRFLPTGALQYVPAKAAA